LRDVAVGVVLAILIVALVFGIESASGWIHVVGVEGYSPTGWWITRTSLPLA
jgi:hypothetical protein